VKLSARDAARFCAAPDLTRAGILLYGADPVEIAEKRRKLVSVLLGDDVGADMRLTRMSGAELRKDGAALVDALKAQGFFGGQQVVLIDDATDGLVKVFEGALSESRPSDAFLVATAGMLPARSKLRKLFESTGNAAAAAFYGDAPDRAAIGGMLKDAGARQVSDEALRDLEALAASIDAGTLRDLTTRLALYTLDQDEPISAADVAVCAPGAGDTAIDEILAAVAEGKTPLIGPLMARMKAQGQAPTSVAIGAARLFRQIHLVGSVGGGDVDSAIGALRPPVFGPRRAALVRQCRIWRRDSAEAVLRLLLETDGLLRGGSGAAGYAILERAFLKIAMTAQKAIKR
jgi:DNA polymerase-3 subunit delta